MDTINKAYELAKEFCKEEKKDTINKLINLVYERGDKHLEITFMWDGIKVNNTPFYFNEYAD